MVVLVGLLVLIWVVSPSERKRREVVSRLEIGVGTDGRLVWYVAVTGKTTLILPNDLSPAGPEGAEGP